ncbi:MAG: peptide chain release factor N(5)-glutamine methyltransferase [Candidatus Bipolaricaulota bacterium]|nr:peptide chain release factor N(5)-glutamine methyltransferase [Candidatus Bipolaricaulota bacterium]MCS7274566.1 peptide chain release factor N(5)-glutamine methyltransferase [Candidatus Bipolaricaulota bacterium]MDW8111004.1 peptide chain release factor N(5)-glutamine methyltransferase [Candidatus Bipolaricaulota bacterium]MDW8329836.1 peptide chain release factor N(5)-glutamine methyltransferase [Candidatus Bipolaricaulota bacterium]
MTVRHALEGLTEYLRGAKVASARLEAEMLLAHALGLDRLDLYLRPERALTEEQHRRVRALAQRRAQGEPLQYLLGSVLFYNVKLRLSPAVLIPRPETEELVELIVKDFLGAPPQRVLDLGTGSGAIAIALAKAWPQTQIVAADISNEALAIAEQNALSNGVQTQILFVRSDWYSALTGSFDLIVSNPPYLRSGALDSVQREVRCEPRLALDGGPDGLDAITRIIRGSVHFLAPHGRLYLEIDADQGERVRRLLLATQIFARAEILQDSSGRARFARAVRSA